MKGKQIAVHKPCMNAADQDEHHVIRQAMAYLGAYDQAYGVQNPV